MRTLAEVGRYFSWLRRHQSRAFPQYPGGGSYAAYAFNVGYARTMMQAALVL